MDLKFLMEFLIKIRSVWLNYTGWALIAMGSFMVLTTTYVALTRKPGLTGILAALAYGISGICLGKAILIWNKKSTKDLKDAL